MKFYTISLIPLILSSVPAMAGVITIPVSVTEEREPDYVLVQAVVTSRCYDSSVKAKEENAALANEIRVAMKSAALRGEPVDNQITTSPGDTNRMTETYYQDNKTQTLCKDKWRTSNTVTMKLINFKDAYSDLQEEVLDIIDKHAEPGNDSPQATWATWLAPQKMLHTANNKALHRAAMRSATAEAYDKLEVFKASCGLDKVELKDIRPASEGAPIYGARKSLAMDSMGGLAERDTTTPALFSPICVTENWIFTFTFKGSSGTCEVEAPSKKPTKK